MKALILVDIQNDFLPGGALAVPDGDAVIPVANKLQSAFPLVVATQDWHPTEHGSFAASHPGKKVFEKIELNGLPQTQASFWRLLKKVAGNTWTASALPAPQLLSLSPASESFCSSSSTGFPSTPERLNCPRASLAMIPAAAMSAPLTPRSVNFSKKPDLPPNAWRFSRPARHRAD